jgi:hypothetical protein
VHHRQKEIFPNPDYSTLHSDLSSSCPSLSECGTLGRWALENDDDQGWQLVRRPRWWRRNPDKKAASKDLAVKVCRKQKFRSILKNRCFNCLAKDHKVSHCHEPKRCWRCTQFDHTSPSCPQKLPSRHLSAKLELRASLSSLCCSPLRPLMEHHLPLGNAVGRQRPQ